MVLDLTLPEIDGLAILRAWRENGRSEPVLIDQHRLATPVFAPGAQDRQTVDLR